MLEIINATGDYNQVWLGHNITNAGAVYQDGTLHPRVNDVFSDETTRAVGSSNWTSATNPRPWKAFNGIWPTNDTDVGWMPNGQANNSWLQYDHVSPMRATGVAMATMAAGTITGAVNLYAIEVSDDGVQWTRIWTLPTPKASNVISDAHFNVFDATARYWRCVCLQHSMNRNPMIRELQYFCRP